MKAYVKPELRFESFVLSQTIASCDLTIGHDDSNKCSIVRDNFLGGAEGGFANLSVCAFEPDYYCYGGPGAAGNPTTWLS